MRARYPQSKHQSAYEFLYLITAAILPVFYLVFWLCHNSQLPTSDATDYIGTAVKTWQHLTENGLLQFDIIRGWRPIFFPALSVPFLLVSHGNIYFAWQAVAIVCMLTTAAYVYLLLRLQLDRVSAVIGANFICLMPFVQSHALTFFSESALLPCILACIYHLIRSNYLRDKKQSYAFVLFLSLAMVIRPVEAIAQLFLIFMALIGLGIYRRIFSFRQLFFFFGLCLSATFLFLFVTATHFISHYPFQPIDGGMFDIKLAKTISTALTAVLLLMLLAWGAVFIIARVPAQSKWYRLLNRTESYSYLLPAFAASFGLVLMWFLPHAFHTFLWIFRTSIGDVAAVTPVAQQTVISGLNHYLLLAGKLLMFGTLGVAMLGLISIQKPQREHVLFSAVFFYILLLIPVPFWMVFCTVQAAPRKLSIAVPALLMLLLIIGLQRGRFWIARASIVTILACVQLAYAISFVIPYSSSVRLTAQYFGDYPLPVTTTPNPNDVVLAFLNHQAQNYQLKSIIIEQNGTRPMSVDTFLLIAMGEISREPFKLTYPYFSSWSQQTPLKMTETADGLFLADIASKMIVSKAAADEYAQQFAAEKNPSHKTMYQIFMHYSQNTLADIGWKAGPCMVVRADGQDDVRGCLLLRDSARQIRTE